MEGRQEEEEEEECYRLPDVPGRPHPQQSGPPGQQGSGHNQSHPQSRLPASRLPLATLIFHLDILPVSHSEKFQSTKTQQSLDLFS